MTTLEILGQVSGFLALGVSFLSYQMKTRQGVIALQFAVSVLITLQYLFIGATSGFALNFICCLRGLCFCFQHKKFLSGKWVPMFFAVLMVVVSIFSWEGIHSLAMVAGLAINTLVMGLCSANTLRKSLLLTCTLVIIYNIVVGSFSGIVFEAVSFISAVIALIRMRKDTVKE